MKAAGVHQQLSATIGDVLRASALAEQQIQKHDQSMWIGSHAQFYTAGPDPLATKTPGVGSYVSLRRYGEGWRVITIEQAERAPGAQEELSVDACRNPKGRRKADAPKPQEHLAQWKHATEPHLQEHRVFENRPLAAPKVVGDGLDIALDKVAAVIGMLIEAKDRARSIHRISFERDEIEDEIRKLRDGIDNIDKEIRSVRNQIAKA